MSNGEMTGVTLTLAQVEEIIIEKMGFDPIDLRWFLQCAAEVMYADAASDMQHADALEQWGKQRWGEEWTSADWIN